MACAAKGYRIQIVSSDAFSREKLDHKAALGAALTIVPSEGGGTTKKLILEMIEAARALSREPHASWTDQLNNHDSIAGYYSLGEGSGVRRMGGSTRSFTAWDGGRRARGILGAAGTSARASQDRRGRDRLRSPTLGADSRGRHPVGQNGRHEGHGEASRAGGGPLRGDVFRSEHRRRGFKSRSGWGPAPKWSR